MMEVYRNRMAANGARRFALLGRGSGALYFVARS